MFMRFFAAKIESGKDFYKNGDMKSTTIYGVILFEISCVISNIINIGIIIVLMFSICLYK